MATGELDLALLAGAAVLLVAIGGVRLSTRAGVPSLLLYLAIGVVLGPDVIGVHVKQVSTARDLGLVALAVIVAEGGLTTDWRSIRPVLPSALLLSTVGLAVSIGMTSLTAHLVMPGGWRIAVITAAAVASTDAAAVFSTLRLLGLPRRLTGVLEAESGCNDAPVVIVVTLLSTHGMDAAGASWRLVYQLGAGAAVGGGVGLLAVLVLRRAALPAVGLYPIATMTFAIASYAAAASADASGFLAVYVTSLVLGNTRLPHRRATVGFADGLTWLAQIGLFVMLGLLVTPSRLPAAVLPALAIGATLLLVARPLSVVLSTLQRSFSWTDRVFVSAAGLRGAVPVVLATIPLTERVAGAQRVFDVVFVLVVVFTLLQAPALSPLARRLGLVAAERGRDLDVEAAPLDHMDADLLTVHVTPESRLHGVEIWELRLPGSAAVSFVVREGRGFVPDAYTKLRHGDDLLVVTARAEREATERRLRAIGRSGRLAGFHGDRGEG